METQLIPEWWDLPKDIIPDIAFLGKVTVKEMIGSWKHDEEEVDYQIKKVKEKMDFLKGKRAVDFVKMAKNFEKPIIPLSQIGLHEGNWTRDPEPLDEESKKRERGSTTFNLCGWCKYASGGIGRYGYMITTSCSFIGDSGAKDVDRRFDTPCFLPLASKETLAKIQSGLRVNLKRLTRELKDVKAKTRHLEELIEVAEKKPALPDFRPHDWFNIGDPVICYVARWKERLLSDVWASAEVIDGYRHHNGCVSVRFEKKMHKEDYLDGHGASYGMSRPEVMHKWEYEYLRAHPEFAKIWVECVSTNLENYSASEMLAALTQ